MFTRYRALVIASTGIAALTLMACSGNPAAPSAATVAPATTTPTATATATATATPISFAIRVVEDEARHERLRLQFMAQFAMRPDSAPDTSGGFVAIEILGYSLRSLPDGPASYQRYLEPARRPYGMGFDISRTPEYFFVTIPGGTAPGRHTLQFTPPGQQPASVTFEVKPR